MIIRDYRVYICVNIYVNFVAYDCHLSVCVNKRRFSVFIQIYDFLGVRMGWRSSEFFSFIILRISLFIPDDNAECW